MPLGASTRQINVYGRRHKRVVSRSTPIEGHDEGDGKCITQEQNNGGGAGGKSGSLGGLTGLGSLSSLFAGLSLSSHKQSSDAPKHETRQVPETPKSQEVTEPAAIGTILETTGQEKPRDFAELTATLCAGRVLSKLGEASYSEVFLLDGSPRTVVKVIPLYKYVPIPAQSAITDVQREMAIMRTLSKMEGFVKLQGMYVVQGKYPATLLEAWDAFREAYPKRCENSRPDFSDDQLYALLLMDDGGKDLEGLSLTWTEAAGVFWQVAAALAAAEELGFEHRDLHMGNILVERVPANNAQTEAPLTHRYGTCAGVRATVIDYSLSRLSADPPLAYLFDDESLFEGQGDPQYDVYRSMRTLVADDWSGSYPITNVLWLQFILQQLLAGDEPTNPAEHRAFESLLMAEQLIDESIDAHKYTAPKRRVSTRSKRRSIQRSPDMWRAPHTLAPVRSVAELVQRVNL